MCVVRLVALTRDAVGRMQQEFRREASCVYAGILRLMSLSAMDADRVAVSGEWSLVLEWWCGWYGADGQVVCTVGMFHGQGWAIDLRYDGTSVSTNLIYNSSDMGGCSKVVCECRLLIVTVLVRKYSMWRCR